MDDQLPVCLKHLDADVMPISGRCCACIAESNEEARPYLETAHNLAEGCRQVLKYVRLIQKDDSLSGEPDR